MQSLLVAIILVACAAYTARRLWRRFTTPPSGSPHCQGCPLAETCEHRHEPTQKAVCPDCERQASCCH
ncbi:MAG: hypothetical protein IJ209_01945 [Bacteroidaceae bacterium]|nr:hypothetical protein [Bacteroidaceae bacterium]